jgi:hypothetical protein
MGGITANGGRAVVFPAGIVSELGGFFPPGEIVWTARLYADHPTGRLGEAGEKKYVP